MNTCQLFDITTKKPNVFASLQTNSWVRICHIFEKVKVNLVIVQQPASKNWAVVLPKPSISSNTVSFDSEASSTVLNKVSNYSQVPIDPSTAKLDPASGKMAKSIGSQQRIRNSEAVRSDTSTSYFQSFREALLSRKCKKALQDTLLVLATIGTACLCSLPTVIYFTGKVGD